MNDIELKDLSCIRTELKGKFDYNKPIQWLYCALIGKNVRNLKNGYNTYTGVVIYKIKNPKNNNDIHYEIKKDIIIGLQSVESFQGKSEIHVNSLRAQVEIHGTTMYCEILNEIKGKSRMIHIKDMHNYDFGVPLINEKGNIIKFENDSGRGQAIVLNIGYSGYINYANGKVRAVVAQSKYGIKKPSLIDVINDTAHYYLNLDKSMVIKLRCLGVLTIQSKQDYFSIDKAKDITISNIKKLAVLKVADKEQKSEDDYNRNPVNFALVLDKHVATRDIDIALFQGSTLLSNINKKEDSIAFIPIDGWKLENVLQKIMLTCKIYEQYYTKLYYYNIIKNKSGNKRESKDDDIVNFQFNNMVIGHITILGVDTITEQNMLGYNKNMGESPQILQIQLTKGKIRRFNFSMSQYRERLISKDLVIHIPNVTKVQKRAFKSFGVRQIKDYNELTIISQRAFEYQDIKKIEIGPKVTKIGQQAYSNQAVDMEYLEIPNNVNFIGGRAFNKLKIDVIKINNPNIQLQQQAFEGWKGKKLIIPKELYNNKFTRYLQRDIKIQTY